jgi:hypothetical protein
MKIEVGRAYVKSPLQWANVAEEEEEQEQEKKGRRKRVDVFAILVMEINGPILSVASPGSLRLHN